MSEKTPPPVRPPKPPLPAFPAEAIQEAVESIRYGIVQLIIQDGRVIQIDKTEKIRLI
ncbi:MAG TPA: YezD family protein [Chthonomonadaceae bacterium]|nr:YezD family protein [Chthonomonadaceae bacterium]